MARYAKKLTAKKITSLDDGYHSDGDNLYLQIKGGAKSWLFIYKRGKKHELGLGAFPDVSLAEARQKASDLRKVLANGNDPLIERKEHRRLAKLEASKNITFAECAEYCLKELTAGLKNEKHVKQWYSSLAEYAYPYIGKMPIKDVGTEDVLNCIQPIWLTKNETASRLRGRIEKVLSWATTKGFCEGDNPARWRGHIENLLAKPSKIQKVEHHPALPYREIAAFMVRLSTQEGIAARCLEFTILTAARTNEAIGATWSEIDWEAKLWLIPKERMKADKPHTVPLSAQVMTLLKNMASIRQNDYVFPSRNKGLSNMAMLNCLKRMERTDLTVHGFRSTFRDWLAEETHYPNHVAEMCLAHTIKNEAEAAYRRGDLLEKRLSVMTDWAVYCTQGVAQ